MKIVCSLPSSTSVKELIIHEKFDLERKTITKLHFYKCVDDLGDTLFIVFTLYCFLLAYLTPLLFMIYFYYGMLLRLFKQARIIRLGITARGKHYAKKVGLSSSVPIYYDFYIVFPLLIHSEGLPQTWCRKT
ncbi:hypothetical protein ANCCAN_06712 [Ancylostoma caninum]|uniref:Uncharacterized protein n=1 Tax=Ancylostoma caninum TaxID=29170 RepID=A0A368GW73_ANCCA|nr:hypothetical protein ANCCAN_06712 [Ancylostoma caninum]